MAVAGTRLAKNMYSVPVGPVFSIEQVLTAFQEVLYLEVHALPGRQTPTYAPSSGMLGDVVVTVAVLATAGGNLVVSTFSTTYFDVSSSPFRT